MRGDQHAVDPRTAVGVQWPRGIETLAIELDLLAAGDQLINIELKNSVKAYKTLESKVLAMVAERRLADRVVLSSFNHYSLQRLREKG